MTTNTLTGREDVLLAHVEYAVEHWDVCMEIESRPNTAERIYADIQSGKQLYGYKLGSHMSPMSTTMYWREDPTTGHFLPDYEMGVERDDHRGQEILTQAGNEWRRRVITRMAQDLPALESIAVLMASEEL